MCITANHYYHYSVHLSIIQMNDLYKKKKEYLTVLLFIYFLVRCNYRFLFREQSFLVVFLIPGWELLYLCLVVAFLASLKGIFFRHYMTLQWRLDPLPVRRYKCQGDYNIYCSHIVQYVLQYVIVKYIFYFK